jgi:hypothetical protein
MTGLLTTADGLAIVLIAVLPLLAAIVRRRGQEVAAGMVLLAVVAIGYSWRQSRQSLGDIPSDRLLELKRAADRRSLFGGEPTSIDDAIRLAEATANRPGDRIARARAMAQLERYDDARAAVATLDSIDADLLRGAIDQAAGDFDASRRAYDSAWQRSAGLVAIRRNAAGLSPMIAAAVVGVPGGLAVRNDIMARVPAAGEWLALATDGIAWASRHLDGGRSGDDAYRRSIAIFGDLPHDLAVRFARHALTTMRYDLAWRLVQSLDDRHTAGRTAIIEQLRRQGVGCSLWRSPSPVGHPTKLEH